MILDRILAHKYLEVAQRRLTLPIEQLREQALAQIPPRDFIGALKRAERPALIAECKKASPSKGLLRPEYDPAELARIYAENGAAAALAAESGDLRAGFAMAKESLESGAALKKLDELVEFSAKA